jgi:hypothetical protein
MMQQTQQNTEIERCRRLIHESGWHILNRKNGKLNYSTVENTNTNVKPNANMRTNQNTCYICNKRCNDSTDLIGIANKKRYIALDTNYGWYENDDLYIHWENTRIFFAILTDIRSEKIMQYLTYEKDGLYPGILIIITNDDNIGCERQFQYYKRKAGNNVFFVWESRLAHLFNKITLCRGSNLSLKETRNALAVYRKTFMTTSLTFDEFKLLAKYREMEKLQEKGYSIQDITRSDINQIVMNRLEQIWNTRCYK